MACRTACNDINIYSIKAFLSVVGKANSARKSLFLWPSKLSVAFCGYCYHFFTSANVLAIEPHVMVSLTDKSPFLCASILLVSNMHGLPANGINDKGVYGRKPRLL